MAHYAFLDDNNVVTEVITGKDETEVLEGLTPEEWYGNFRGQRCVRTSYNTFGNTHLFNGIPYRFNYASIGYFFDETIGEDGAFIPPKQYASWTLNEDTCLWEAPTPMPEDDKFYTWNESELKWEEVNG